jgi:hypothetical protein
MHQAINSEDSDQRRSAISLRERNEYCRKRSQGHFIPNPTPNQTTISGANAKIGREPSVKSQQTDQSKTKRPTQNKLKKLRPVDRNQPME